MKKALVFAIVALLAKLCQTTRGHLPYRGHLVWWPRKLRFRQLHQMRMEQATTKQMVCYNMKRMVTIAIPNHNMDIQPPRILFYSVDRNVSCL